MALLRPQTFVALSLFTNLALVLWLLASRRSAGSYMVTSSVSKNTDRGVNEAVTFSNPPVDDTLPETPATKFDILDATKNETLGFGKIFYISLPQ